MSGILAFVLLTNFRTGFPLLWFSRVLARPLKPLKIPAETQQFLIASAERLNVGVLPGRSYSFHPPLPSKLNCKTA
jgi:hypothetical protein